MLRARMKAVAVAAMAIVFVGHLCCENGVQAEEVPASVIAFADESSSESTSTQSTVDDAIPHYACTSFAEHECPIAPEQQWHEERCAESASNREQTCKLRGRSSASCKYEHGAHHTMCESKQNRWKFIGPRIQLSPDEVPSLGDA